jgi:hypothetical protein
MWSKLAIYQQRNKSHEKIQSLLLNPATSNQQPVTSNKQPAASNQ